MITAVFPFVTPCSLSYQYNFNNTTPVGKATQIASTASLNNHVFRHVTPRRWVFADVSKELRL